MNEPKRTAALTSDGWMFIVELRRDGQVERRHELPDHDHAQSIFNGMIIRYGLERTGCGVAETPEAKPALVGVAARARAPRTDEQLSPPIRRALSRVLRDGTTAFVARGGGADQLTVTQLLALSRMGLADVIRNGRAIRGAVLRPRALRVLAEMDERDAYAEQVRRIVHGA